MPLKVFTKTNLILLVIVLAGLFFRAYNLDHGVGAHPDERGSMMTIDRLSWDNLHPGGFHYGTFPYYMVWVTSKVLGKTISPTLESYDSLFIIGRAYSVAFGILGVVLLYFLAMKVYANRSLALFASSLLALNTFSIQISRFFAVDVFLMTTSLATILALLYFIRTGKTWLYAVVGVCLGVSFGIKLAALALGVPVLVAFISRFIIAENTKLKIAIFPGAVIVLVVAALTVFLVEPYFYLDFDTFVRNNKDQMNFVSGSWVPPYGVQYQNTAPYFYPIEQIMFYTMGIPTFLCVVLGAIFVALKQFNRVTRNAEEIVLLAWVVVVFGVMAGYQVKFPRYLAIIYPQLFLFAAFLVFSAISQFKSSKILSISGGLIALVVLGHTSALAYAHNVMYRQPHVWQTASKWIYENIPDGSFIADVHWDDRLPQGVPGYSKNYNFISLPLYEEETQERWGEVCENIAKADYIIFPTKRFYGSISRDPVRFLYGNSFIDLLFTGRLGYHLANSFKVRPRTRFFEIDDDGADESLAVYDHPKVTIFKNLHILDGMGVCLLIKKHTTRSKFLTYLEIVRVGQEK